MLLNLTTYQLSNIINELQLNIYQEAYQIFVIAARENKKNELIIFLHLCILGPLL